LNWMKNKSGGTESAGFAIEQIARKCKLKEL